MFCSRCGVQLPDPANFCPRCGTKVIPFPAQNPSPTVRSQSGPHSTPVRPFSQGNQTIRQAPPPTPTKQPRERLLFPAISAVQFEQELSNIPLVDVTPASNAVCRHMIENMREIKFTNFTRSSNVNNLFPLVVLDTETTGFSPTTNDIIELSAIKFDVGFRPVSAYTCLLKPRRKIPEAASAVNHITEEMVAGCPKFQHVASDFQQYISGCNIAGHNLIFDLKFLYAGGMDLPDGIKYYDTLSLAKNTLVAEGQKVYDHHAGKYFKATEYDIDNLQLVTLCDYYGVQRTNAHRALSDCLATAKVFERLIADKTR